MLRKWCCCRASPHDLPALIAIREDPRLRRLYRCLTSPLVRLAFLLLGVLFLALVLRSRWHALQQHRFHIQAWRLLASYLLLCLAWLLEVSLWRALLSSLGARLSPRRAMSVWFLSNLVRYVPGNVWQFLGMMELGAASRVPRGAMLGSIGLHQVLSNASGLLVGSYAILVWSGIPSSAAAMVAGGFLALVVPLGPLLLGRTQRLVASLSGTERASTALSPPASLLILPGYCLHWLVIGSGFWFLSSGIGAIGSSGVLVSASAFAGAYVLGYLSLLTPSGLGVREGVLAILLTALTGSAGAAAAALASRVWLTAGELAGSAVAATADSSVLLRPESG